eukprot:c879_g1_i1 orf=182-1015(+)
MEPYNNNNPYNQEENRRFPFPFPFHQQQHPQPPPAEPPYPAPLHNAPPPYNPLPVPPAASPYPDSFHNVATPYPPPQQMYPFPAPSYPASLPHNTTPYPPHHYPPTVPAAEEVDCKPADLIELPRGQLVRVFCKSNRDFNLAVRHDGVVMVSADSEDATQQWIKDETPGMRVRDVYGFPAFCLVNKAHKKIVKHAKEKGQQLLLIDYKPGILDDDILWTESQDFGEGYKTVRMASDTLLNMTVFHGDKKSGGLKDGSPVVLDTWHKQDYQLWKIFPF